MIDLRLLWVPPKTKQETIRKILKCYFEKEIILEKHTGEEVAVRWSIQVKKEEEHKIPHYIPISVQTGDPSREDLWFVSKRGKTTRMLLLQRRWPLASRLQKENRKKENGQRNKRAEKTQRTKQGKRVQQKLCRHG